MTAEFRVLGTLEVTVRGRVVPLPAGRGRVVLAGLLLRANEVVPVEQLLDWLFDGALPPPDRAVKILHMVMARLRKALGEANVVVTAPSGYLAVVRPEQLDLARFRRLTAAGAHAEALSLWQEPGPVLTDVVSASLHRDEIAPLAEERLAALELRIEADLVSGRHLDVLPELRSLTRAHPLRESFWAQLILALHRADQQEDALAAYRTVTRLLDEESDGTPGQRLHDLHQRILGGAAHESARQSVPRQLPATNPAFVGRENELKALGELIGTDATTIAIINGTAGVGKTTLAIHWAHLVADQFPDGQLYVNLRGFDPTGTPVRTEDALRGFLDALGTPPEQIESTVDGRAAQLRGLLADRKVLVLLDNARDAEQVRPLLPASAGCPVVVTSRNQLADLVAQEGARPLALPTLAGDQAADLLERHLGADRLRAEPGAAAELIDRCAGLPLALSVMAARAAINPGFSLGALADELADEATRLDVLGDDDTPTSLRAVFSWSYQQLGPAAARLFRLLGLHPGQEIGVHAAASLAELSLAEAGRLFAELQRAQLVTEHVPNRFGFHDLLRVYAAELVERHEQEPALNRLLDHYLHCADIADDLMPLARNPMGIAPRHRPAETPPLATADDAMTWFGFELRNVIAAIEAAATQGRPTHAWQLTYTLSRFLWLRADWPTLIRVCQTALPCTEGMPEPRLAMLMNIGVAHRQAHEHAEAVIWLTKALEVEDAPVVGHARVLITLAATLETQQRYDEAEQRYNEATARANEANAPWIEAIARQNLGDVHILRHQLDEAEREFRTALEIQTRVGEKIGALACHLGLGRVHLRRGQYDTGLSCARTALEMARENNSPYHEADSFGLIGDTLDRMGAEGAAEHWEKALAIFEELGAPEADDVREKLAQAERNVCR